MSTVNVTIADPCANAVLLSQNAALKSVLFVKSLICVVGLIIWVFFLISKPWRLILHMNARAMICYHSILCCMLLAVNLPMHTEHLIRLFGSYSDPCDYKIPRPISFYFQFSAFALIVFQAITNALFAIERIACSLNRRFYERKEYPKIIFFVLFLSTLLLVYGLHEFLAEGINWNSSKLGFSTRDKNNQYATKTILIFIFCLEIVTICSFQAVHFVNKRTSYRMRYGNDQFKTFGCELSVKLQIRESIRVTEMWTPIAVMHCFIFLIASAGLYINLWAVNDEILQVIIGESVSMNIVYSVFLPIYVLAKNPALFWQTLAKLTGNRVKRETRVKDADKNTEFTQYFDNLKVLFTQPSLERASAYDGQKCWNFCCY